MHSELILTHNQNATTATLQHSFRYTLTSTTNNEFILFPKGYKFDGVSLPAISKILRPWIPRWQFAASVAAHDKLCMDLWVFSGDPDDQGLTGWRKITRGEIDREFKASLIASGCSKAKAQLYYLSVRLYYYLGGYRFYENRDT